MNKDFDALKANIPKVIANLKQSLRKALEKLQDIQGNNYRLGVLHLERGNLTDAIFRFTLVTRLAPKHVEAWLKLSEAQLKKGDRAAAKKSFSKAKQLSPMHPDIPALVEKFADAAKA
jgi:Flp pilus assembly protein TadD